MERAAGAKSSVRGQIQAYGIQEQDRFRIRKNDIYKGPIYYQQPPGAYHLDNTSIEGAEQLKYFERLNRSMQKDQVRYDNHNNNQYQK